MANVSLMGWDADAKVWRKVLVNAAGKLIIDPSEIFEDPPTDGEAGKAPTSNWAHDHAADESAHHTRYTDNEALMVRTKYALTLTGGIYTNLNVAGKSILFLDTTVGNIVFKGLAGGVDGQMLLCHRTWYSSNIVIHNDSSEAAAGNRLRTYNGGINTMSYGYWGSFWLIYIGGYWYVMNRIDLNPRDLFLDIPYSYVHDKGPSLFWAYYHVANPAAHHTRYTDAEAMWARYNTKKILTAGTYTAENVAGVGMLILDTDGGDINLKGLAGGTDGLLLFCFKTNDSNAVNVYHLSGDADAGNKILTSNDLTNTVSATHTICFTLFYYATIWHVDRIITI